MNHKFIQLNHGGGGKEMSHLINHLFFKYFNNDQLLKQEDAATLKIQSPIAFTTDSFTVSPLFFQGGNIGTLAIAGTVNDLAMVGAKPEYLSCSFIIEEGFSLQQLEQIVISMAQELSVSGAQIVCGDTKVVPIGCADGLFINTSGLGQIVYPAILYNKGFCNKEPNKEQTLSAHNLINDDLIIVSRDIGCHGAAILMARAELELESDLKSDCASLWPVVDALIQSNITMHALRDATRGGIAAVLNEWAQASTIGITINESEIPVSLAVQGLCELYGFEPYDLANEGTFIIALPKEEAQQALTILSKFNNQARIIGYCHNEHATKVILKNSWGSSRYLDVPQGELLPRIC